MSQVGRNIWFASLSFLIPSIFTYIFWFFTARMAGPEAIGIASTIGSITIIFATIDVLDVSLGMKRSLGSAFAKGELWKFKQILTSATIFVSIPIIFTISILAIPQFHLLDNLGIDKKYMWIVMAMVPALSYQYIFTEALISSLKSRNLFLPLMVGSALRFPILLVFVYVLNAPIEGSVIAFSSLIFVPTILYAYFLRNFLQGKPRFNPSKILSDVKEILRPSLASWFPHMLSVLGSQLGVVMVFSFSGSSAGGLFYIPMAIFSVVLFLVTGMNKVTHPLVAGMDSGTQQVDLFAQLIKLAFAFTMPIVALLLFYSVNFLELLGTDFSQAATTLSIMMLAIPIGIISEMVYYFVYGRGDNKSVLYLGLFANCPRIIFYFILTPEFGGPGAAIAYLIGSISQVLLTVRIAHSHSLKLRYGAYLVTTAIPLILGLFLWLLGVNYLASIVIIPLVSLLLYMKLGILNESDIMNIVSTCLPANTAKKLYPSIRFIFSKLT